MMQGVLGCLLSFAAFRARAYLPLVVFCGMEYVLTAVCGAGWYWFTEVTGEPALGALCTRDHGWTWSVILICVLILGGIHVRDSSARPG